MNRGGKNILSSTQIDTLNNFSKILNQPDMSDITFRVHDKKIYAHRAILGAQSVVLAKMLYGKMKEGKAGEVEIKDSQVTPKSFLSFLQCVYTGSVDLDQDNVLSLLYLGKLYQVHTLIDNCLAFITRSISVDTAMYLWDSMIQLDEPEMAKRCHECVSRKTQDSLSKVNPEQLSYELLLDLVQADTLSSPEIVLFEFVLQWIKNGSTTRPKDQINTLLSHIRYPQISGSDLKRKVRPTGLVPQELLLEAYEFHVDKTTTTNAHYKEIRFLPRCGIRADDKSGAVVQTKVIFGERVGEVEADTSLPGFPGKSIRWNDHTSHWNSGGRGRHWVKLSFDNSYYVSKIWIAVRSARKVEIGYQEGNGFQVIAEETMKTSDCVCVFNVSTTIKVNALWIWVEGGSNSSIWCTEIYGHE